MPTRAGSGAGDGQSLHRRDAAVSHLRDSDGPHALFRRRARDRAARLRGHGGARQIPDARRGDRMIQAPDLPLWAAIAVGFFVLLGASITLVGALGLLRMGNFYERIHPPTLGPTWGTMCILIASMISFSTRSEEHTSELQSLMRI